MKNREISEDLYRKILLFQREELTEYLVYKELARASKRENKKVFLRISEDEKRHYDEWKKYTGEDVLPDRFKVFFYIMISKIFGVTFSVKMMENNEREAEKEYALLVDNLPDTRSILEDEIKHEKMLIGLINEEKIDYIGSMVLGLNDALVELTGTLSGLSFALQNAKTVGIAGLITGIAASLSMSASEYLSQKSEAKDANPLKASLYTGIAYIFTVLFLVFPYFIFSNYLLALGFTLFNALIVVLFFSFFVSVVKEMGFKNILLEMLVISFGVAFLSFLIGVIVRSVFKIEI